jgi:general secretion pathway protein G
MRKQGFSLVEVLVALVIVAIMSTVVAVNLIGTSSEARVASAQSQLANFETALSLYNTQQGTLPTLRQGLAALVEAPAVPPLPPRYPQGGYLNSSSVPDDPWGNPYIYLTPGRNGEPFEVISYGADGLEGGEGFDADLSTSD